MKYKEFMKIVDKWSYNDIVCFLMDYPDWCDGILAYIHEEWTEDEQIELENEQVEALNKNQVVAGVTILKRLVPGWFARADIGTDALNIGFSLEF